MRATTRSIIMAALAIGFSLALLTGADCPSDPAANVIPTDNCPDDPDKTEPGDCGCGVADTDSDGDGTPDCNDNCPNDPDKTTQGDCGCGVAETDTDGDGTPDCNDGCQTDPDKTAQGDCGCFTPETDHDGDGTPDCVDGCPDDPDKTDAGVCGCGLPETCVVMETVTVGNPGNGDDSHDAGYGSVAYTYDIGKYEVTAGQYAEFLNAVAATDTYGLYNTNMDSQTEGCQITQNGSSGSYTYDFSGRPSGTEADWVDRPVNWVSWGDAARFVNWMHNGQPSGAQDLTTTEDGSYYLNGATTNSDYNTVTREGDASWVLPTEDEWYKAAYHKNDGVTSNYFDYPTSSDSATSNDLGNPTDPGNNATYYVAPGDYTIDTPYFRTEFGAHENSDSPYGTFDQGGNVAEWNESYDAGNRGIRGGAYDVYMLVDLTAAMRGSESQTAEATEKGFRVGKMPE